MLELEGIIEPVASPTTSPVAIEKGKAKKLKQSPPPNGVPGQILPNPNGEPTEAELNGEREERDDRGETAEPARVRCCRAGHSLDGRWRRRCRPGSTNRPGLG
ncbi:hypothetical protein C2845_PM02G14760 [Panicum miliaceum]|uniref:Uncharacterized protein n=1 Tax=Panicum miliaceum TaxID=4540 RepID=A0A3L6S3W4_PANMI|nr:hypothetical protein C2845_PM02G14760 [Panicum miliaceum]